MFLINNFRNFRHIKPKKFNISLRTLTKTAETTTATLPKQKTLLEGPNLKDFFKDEHLKSSDHLQEEQVIPYLQTASYNGQNRKVYFDVYGCQMNVNDTEIVWSILKNNGFLKTNTISNADVILLVTCAIREGAEQKIWNRLDAIKGLISKHKRNGVKIGILGCMAERLKHKVLEINKSVDLVAGPDSYRDLPRLLALTENNQTAVNVLLSLDETYADVMPVRLNRNSISAFVSIMRGCDNMCSYCIVPFTRGRERSRPIASILDEVRALRDQGVKEITLLGQNVNSYRDLSQGTTTTTTTNLSRGFRTVYKPKENGLRFADLLHRVADVDAEVRIRFTSPHPKDFPDEVLQAIRSHSNICRNLHLPAQSGNSNVLERMRRGYTRQSYVELVDHVRSILPNVALSSDFITGFCGETEEEFEDTLSLIKLVGYNNAYLFPYSTREKTTAHRRYKDDVPERVKLDRMKRMVDLYRREVAAINRSQIGTIHLVLIEGHSKRSRNQLAGRNDQNVKVIIPAGGEVCSEDGTDCHALKCGDYVAVQINDATSQVLKGIPLFRTTLAAFTRNNTDFDDYNCGSMVAGV